MEIIALSVPAVHQGFPADLTSIDTSLFEINQIVCLAKGPLGVLMGRKNRSETFGISDTCSSRRNYSSLPDTFLYMCSLNVYTYDRYCHRTCTLTNGTDGSVNRLFNDNTRNGSLTEQLAVAHSIDLSQILILRNE